MIFSNLLGRDRKVDPLQLTFELLPRNGLELLSVAGNAITVPSGLITKEFDILTEYGLKIVPVNRAALDLGKVVLEDGVTINGDRTLRVICTTPVVECTSYA